MSSYSIVKGGFTALRRFLQKESAKFAAAPMLLVESHNIDDDNNNNNNNNNSKAANSIEACKQARFLCSMALNFRTVPCHPTSMYYASMKDIDMQLELAQRVGASTVIGVGDENAIDLAKAIVQQSDQQKTMNVENLILLPATHEATLLSTLSHALVMDSTTNTNAQNNAEPALIALPNAIPSLPSTSTTIFTMKSSGVPSTDQEEQQFRRRVDTMLYTSLVIALDALYNQNEDPTVVQEKIISLIKILVSYKEPKQLLKDEHETIMEILTWAGQKIAFGFSKKDTERRSIPLSLSVSLVPTVFPDYDLWDFMACLLPGMLQLPSPTGGPILLEQAMIPAILDRAPKFTMSSQDNIIDDDLSSDRLLSRVHENQILWNCWDKNDSVLRTVLQTSLDSAIVFSA